MQRRTIIFILVFLGILPSFAKAQLVEDFLIVRFDTARVQRVPLTIDAVVDARDRGDDVLAVTEVNRYFFVPVDLIVKTERSLSREIESLMTETYEPGLSRYRLKIDVFDLAKKSGLIYPHFALYASVEVQAVGLDTSTESLGRLDYEITRRTPIFNPDLREGYESVMHGWQDRFVRDLSIIAGTGETHPVTENLRSADPLGRMLNLYGGVDVTAMLDGWILDAQVFASSREAKRSFFRSGGYHLRFRDEQEFDAIEFGLATDYWHYRLHRNWMFRFKTQILLGINRWDDIDEGHRKLWDIVLADVSMSQMLHYNPLGRGSVIIGVGLMESLNYVYSKGLRFQPGLVFQVGFKL